MIIDDLWLTLSLLLVEGKLLRFFYFLFAQKRYVQLRGPFCSQLHQGGVPHELWHLLGTKSWTSADLLCSQLQDLINKDLLAPQCRVLLMIATNTKVVNCWGNWHPACSVHIIGWVRILPSLPRLNVGACLYTRYISSILGVLAQQSQGWDRPLNPYLLFIYSSESTPIRITWFSSPLAESVQRVIGRTRMQNETMSSSWDPTVLLAACLHLWPREWATDSPYWYQCCLPTWFNQLLGCIGGQWYQRAIRLDRISDMTLYSCYWATVHIWSHSLPLKHSARIVKLLGPTNHTKFRVFSLFLSILT